MAEWQRSAAERARLVRAAAMLCAGAMLALAAWLILQHGIAGIIALDPERMLTLEVYLALHAVSLFAAAEPARALSGPIGARLAVAATATAAVNVVAAAFFGVDAALAWTVIDAGSGPNWVLSLLVPAGVSIALLAASFGVAPEEPAEISDDDITEAALILTEAQRRWSWRAVFAMAEYMALSRGLILAAYFAALVAAIGVFDWLSKVVFESRALGGDELRASTDYALTQGAVLLTHAGIWGVFIVIAVVPPLLILVAAAWYRFQVRRERARVRALSQSPAAARLMTKREMVLWRGEERRFPKAAVTQRAVS